MLVFSAAFAVISVSLVMAAEPAKKLDEPDSDEVTNRNLGETSNLRFYSQDDYFRHPGARPSNGQVRFQENRRFSQGHGHGQQRPVTFYEGKDTMADIYRRRKYYGPPQGAPYVPLAPAVDYNLDEPARIDEVCRDHQSGAIFGECVPLIHCPRFFRRLVSVKNEGLASTTTVTTVPTKRAFLSRCPLDNIGSVGVCCPLAEDFPATPAFVPPSGPQNVGNVFPTYVQDPNMGIFSRNLPKSDIDKAMNDARRKIQELDIDSRQLIASGNHIEKGSPAAQHQSFNRASETAQALGNQALAEIEAARALRTQFGGNNRA